MRILIVYSSRDGQTRKIAQFIATQLGDMAACDVVDVRQTLNLPLTAYDRVIIWRGLIRCRALFFRSI